jgi:polar amino acid transport system substrate-binding protein
MHNRAGREALATISAGNRVERHAIAIPKGRDQGRAFVEKFTADAKSEGLVKAAIARAGLRGAMTSDSK